MSEVKRYRFISSNGYAAIPVVDSVKAERYVDEHDFDRVTAELDAAKETLERWRELNLQREARMDALQQRLTAADERADVLEGLLTKYHNRSDVCAFMAKDIGAALNPTGEVFIVNGRETTERPVCTVRECGKFAEAPWTNCREHWR